MSRKKSPPPLGKDILPDYSAEEAWKKIKSNQWSEAEKQLLLSAFTPIMGEPLKLGQAGLPLFNHVVMQTALIWQVSGSRFWILSCAAQIAWDEWLMESGSWFTPSWNEHLKKLSSQRWKVLMRYAEANDFFDNQEIKDWSKDHLY